MADYFAHWLEMGRRAARVPKIFHVNWFRRDAQGQLLWPGFGEKLRVLDWILHRSRGEVGGRKTAIGYVPRPDDLELTGLDITRDALESLFALDKKSWMEEVAEQRRFFAQFGTRLPGEIVEEIALLEDRLQHMA